MPVGITEVLKDTPLIFVNHIIKHNISGSPFFYKSFEWFLITKIVIITGQHIENFKDLGPTHIPLNVNISDSILNTILINTGAPQGWNLFSVLYPICTNYSRDTEENTHLIEFADDTT